MFSGKDCNALQLRHLQCTAEAIHRSSKTKTCALDVMGICIYLKCKCMSEVLMLLKHSHNSKQQDAPELYYSKECLLRWMHMRTNILQEC